ncbi:hypothetical protein QLQ15_06610 [Lysobacter sp. LF1]|uniref:Outer membrane protein beta-barrel domain-containing protein n=1 Tax=Lysobacter stagni TaxID=3045172 RepID=A0ABT6XEM6_9GAMM|nr:hypothetical protein [Lysobacter sp. LF1]MDI9238585.1 hypothetical protein [Lysobacter sp. LF1]
MKHHSTLLAAILLACASMECAAVEPLDTFSARIGGYITDFDTEVRADGETARGTEVDFNRDLGLDESNTVAYLGFTWRPFDHHEFGLAWYQDSADGRRQITRDIEFDGTRYEALSTVKAEFDLDAYEAYYVWWGLDRDSWTMGPRVGLIWYKLDLSIDMQVDSAGNRIDGAISDSINADLPAPTIGGSWRWVPGQSDWRLSADIGYFSADVNDIDADVTFGRFGAEWFPWERFGFWADYTVRRIEADASKTSFDGNLRFIDTGIRFGGVYRF